MIKKYALILGCGGIGMPLTQKLRFVYDKVNVFDGDVFEKKNEDRQMARSGYHQVAKVNMARSFHEDIILNSRMFMKQHIEQLPREWIYHVFLTVDNAKARTLVYEWAKESQQNSELPLVEAVFTGANELHTGEAYVWFPALSPALIPDPTDVFPMAWYGGQDQENAPHCHQLEQTNAQLAAVNMSVAGDLFFLAQAWSNIEGNPSFITDGVPLPWCVRTSLVRKEVDYVSMPVVPSEPAPHPEDTEK